MMKESVGIINGSFKPFHLGHYNLINKASKENQQVILYVSLNDRIKKNEFPIFGTDMAYLWINQYCDLIPPNVKIIFVKDESPVKKIYSLLGKSQDNNGSEIYRIYSESNDILKNFPESAIQKYLPKLMGDGRLYFISVNRGNEISGTLMRQFLMDGDKESFLKNLPNVKDKEAIWNILSRRKPISNNKISWSF